jgi:ATP synthase F1 gamma subunit
MQNLKSIEEEIETMETFRMITQAYEEISVMRMQRIRGSVIATRDFLDELSKVYVDIKANYRSQIVNLLTGKRKKVQDVLDVNKNGKTVTILMSTNTKLSGEIVRRVFRQFIDYVENNDTEVVIIGRQGKNMYENHKATKPYKYYEFKENDISIESLKEIILGVYPYKKVNVFFGKFESLLTQDPTFANITGEDVSDDPNAKPEAVTPYLFEPSIEKILQFFETQIFSSLVKQTVNESELARYASRIRAMEDATTHIDKTKLTLAILKRKMKQILTNRKQLEITKSAIRLVDQLSYGR